jgi:hypothetical protein
MSLPYVFTSLFPLQWAEFLQILCYFVYWSFWSFKNGLLGKLRSWGEGFCQNYARDWGWMRRSTQTGCLAAKHLGYHKGKDTYFFKYWASRPVGGAQVHHSGQRALSVLTAAPEMGSFSFLIQSFLRRKWENQDRLGEKTKQECGVSGDWEALQHELHHWPSLERREPGF